MKPYKTNIEKDSIKNKNYRKVLFTGKKMQLVVMNLNPMEEIPFEVHKDREQFIRVESGQADLIIDGKKYILKTGEAIIIPAGAKHFVANKSSKKLKLYTIYASPEHPKETVDKTFAHALRRKS